MEEAHPLLHIKNFSLSFRMYGRGLQEKRLNIIRHLNLTVNAGEVVAIVGASGSGKSLLANALLGILPQQAHTSGDIFYKGRRLTQKLARKIRGREISYIPQSVASLDPLMKAGKQVQLGLKGKNKREAQEMLFKQAGLPPNTAEKYPFELSGGMARRVMAAAALTRDVQLLVADEPTPGLDPTALKETLLLIKQLAAEGKGIVFITHDIEAAVHTASRIVVFHDGEVVEIAPAKAFSGEGEHLNHSYTKKLWNALPQNQPLTQETGHKLTHLSDQGSLEVNGITFAYDRGPNVFKNLSLKVRRGEIVGLSGYSGSGKTTMAKILSGYLKPKEGHVTIKGEAGLSEGMHPIQMIWQHPEESVNPRWKMKKVLTEGEELDAGLLKEMGIRKEWSERRPSELSGGELQRFCVARALQKKTKFIIADEMTTMLDAITQKELWEVLIQLAKQQQIGVLAISHDEALLKRISDRIIRFEDIRYGTTNQKSD